MTFSKDRIQPSRPQGSLSSDEIIFILMDEGQVDLETKKNGCEGVCRTEERSNIPRFVKCAVLKY